MDEKTYKEIQDSFTAYLTEKKLRKTEERYTILEKICSFSGHFDIVMLHQKLDETRFHVSKATLYNTLDVLVDAGLIIRHQLNSKSVQYELRNIAETHLHLICMKCGNIRELKNTSYTNFAKTLKITRFTAEFYSLYIYGICSKCKNKGSKK